METCQNELSLSTLRSPTWQMVGSTEWGDTKGQPACQGDQFQGKILLWDLPGQWVPVIQAGVWVHLPRRAGLFSFRWAGSILSENLSPFLGALTLATWWKERGELLVNKKEIFEGYLGVLSLARIPSGGNLVSEHVGRWCGLPPVSRCSPPLWEQQSLGHSSISSGRRAGLFRSYLLLRPYLCPDTWLQ